MEFTQGAKALIETNLNDIMGYMTLATKDRADVEKELRSSFYDRSEAVARERGAGPVTEEDVRKAVRDEGTPQEIALDYMKSYVGQLKRAGFWWRLAAFIIDGFILGIIMFILICPFLLVNILADRVQQTPLVVALVIVVNLVISAIMLAVLVCYTVVFEGRWGRTPGKYIAGLKVIKVDGTPIGYKEALLRNIPKFFGNVLIVIDALIMVLFFNKEKQRAFDKVADTIVVHTRD